MQQPQYIYILLNANYICATYTRVCVYASVHVVLLNASSPLNRNSRKPEDQKRASFNPGTPSDVITDTRTWGGGLIDLNAAILLTLKLEGLIYSLFSF